MTIAGYLEWEREFGERRPQLAGVELQGFPRSVRWARQADAELLRMDDGSTVAQSSLVGPDAPAGRSPYRVSFDLLFGSVQDFDLVQEAAGRGEPVLFFPGWWHVDQWLVPVGGTGRTTWRTSRRLAFGLTAQPEVLLDGAPLARVPGAPNPGEARIPTANDGPGEHNAVIETGPLDGARWLTLRYPAEYQIRFLRLEQEIPEANFLTARAEAEEHLPARFTLF